MSIILYAPGLGTRDADATRPLRRMLGGQGQPRRKHVTEDSDEAKQAAEIFTEAGGSPPRYLGDWLQRWVALRHIADAALAVLGNVGFKKEPFSYLARSALSNRR